MLYIMSIFYRRVCLIVLKLCLIVTQIEQYRYIKTPIGILKLYNYQQVSILEKKYVKIKHVAWIIILTTNQITICFIIKLNNEGVRPQSRTIIHQQFETLTKRESGGRLYFIFRQVFLTQFRGPFYIRPVKCTALWLTVQYGTIVQYGTNNH